MKLVTDVTHEKEIVHEKHERHKKNQNLSLGVQVMPLGLRTMDNLDRQVSHFKNTDLTLYQRLHHYF